MYKNKCLSSLFPNLVDNNFVSYLTQTERTSLERDFQSIFVYISILLTLLVLVFTYITINLYLRLKHSKSIETAERTRQGFKDNIVSLKTMIFLVLLGSTTALYHVYNNSQVPVDHRNSVPLGTIYFLLLGVLLHLTVLLTRRDLKAYLGRLVLSVAEDTSSWWLRIVTITNTHNQVAPIQ